MSTRAQAVILHWPTSDASVLDRARRGDPAALEALFRTFEKRIYSLALRIVGRVEDAEEIVQETFLEVARSLPRYRADGSLWAWIRQITASKALMRIRREKRRQTDPLPEDDAGAPAPLPAAQRQIDHAARLDLESALASLEPTARAVVWLHDVEGLTHREIASLAGRSESFSKSQLSRAHARLRELLLPGAADVARAREDTR